MNNCVPAVLVWVLAEDGLFYQSPVRGGPGWEVAWDPGEGAVLRFELGLASEWNARAAEWAGRLLRGTAAALPPGLFEARPGAEPVRYWASPKSVHWRLPVVLTRPLPRPWVEGEEGRVQPYGPEKLVIACGRPWG